MVSDPIPAEGQLVLDSSAVLAWLREETGQDVVQSIFHRAIMNAVNWVEVVQRGGQLALSPTELRSMLEAEGLTITDFSIEEANTAGQLFEATRNEGLSLGDRACLASAIRLGVPAVTADGPWLRVSVGIDIVLIR